MQTPDRTQENIEHIARLFPNVITEAEDENGNIKKAIDFDLLRQQLSDALVEDDSERYRLDWPGKKASLLKANTPITKTLRPCREESVNFDTTENQVETVPEDRKNNVCTYSLFPNFTCRKFKWPEAKVSGFKGSRWNTAHRAGRLTSLLCNLHFAIHRHSRRHWVKHSKITP